MMELYDTKPLSKPGIKICGLQDLAAVEAAVHYGATHVGFVFAKSRRQVTSKLAAELAAPASSVDKVGVFVNPTMKELELVLSQVPLTVVQLHGSETPDFCEEVKAMVQPAGVKVWKALPMTGPDATPVLLSYVNVVDGLLVDSYSAGQSGGSGEVFSWELLPDLQTKLQDSLLQSRRNIPLWVAGGLHPGNVFQLLSNYCVQGVDVSSGVEVNQKKSPERIREFIAEVKRIS